MELIVENDDIITSNIGVEYTLLTPQEWWKPKRDSIRLSPRTKKKARFPSSYKIENPKHSHNNFKIYN